MQKRSVPVSLFIALLALVLFAGPALAFPPLPSSFYGYIEVNGENVPDGTLVRALVGGQVYAEARTRTYEGSSVYSLDTMGDDDSTTEIEGGKEGDTIQFEVGGALAEQTGTWHSGTNVQLDLSVQAAGALATPAPTEPPVPTQTAITVVEPPAATEVRGTEAQPAENQPAAQPQATEAVQALVKEDPSAAQPAKVAATPTAVAGASTSGSPSAQASPGAGGWVVGLVVVLAAGAGAWTWLSRRRGK